MRVCFVCLGNICRSPAAKAVFTKLAEGAGLEVTVDAAGTSRYHLGEPPHELTRAEARGRGLPLEHLGRVFTGADFDRFDLVVAMDRGNEEDLLALAPDGAARRKVVRVGAFAGDVDPGDAASIRDVADPWGLDGEAFAAMYDHLELAAAGLVRRLQEGTLEEVLAAPARR